MSNDHVHPFFAGLLNDVTRQSKRHLQNQRPTNRDRFRALEAIHAELEAAGAVIDLGQLDWACSEVERRVYERSLERQYAYKQSRKESPEPTGQDFDEPCEYCGQDGHQGGCRAHERHDRRCL